MCFGTFAFSCSLLPSFLLIPYYFHIIITFRISFYRILEEISREIFRFYYESQYKEEFYGMKLKSKPLHNAVAAAGLALVLILCAVVGIGLSAPDDSGAEVVTASTLSKIIEISDLSTYRTMYNGVAQAMDEKSPDKVDYYVAYEATVEAGIDFSQVQVAVDNEAKTVTITLPQASITDVLVDSASLDYIFVDKKSETATVSEQALKLCQADVEQETATQEGILDLAQQNARNVVEALTRPLLDQSNPDYTLTVQ